MLKKMKSIPLDLPLETFLDRHFFKARPGAWAEGTWGENVGSWLGARQRDESFLLLRYEDARADPERALKRAAEHLGIPATPTSCKRVVALSRVPHVVGAQMPRKPA
jgi:hypothetical protein